MPLNDSFKLSAAATSMKLPKMASVPTVDDISFVLSLAVKNQKNIVELPWKSANNPINYIIKVTCAQSLEVPTWYLHVGGDEDQPVLWNYDTADAPLIHSLITAECERTTYTAPLEQESGVFPAEVQFPDVVNNVGPEPYLPREHEQPIPSFSATAAARPAVDTSLNWNNQTAPSSQNSNLQTAPGSVPSVPNAPRPLPQPIDLDRAAVDNMYKSFTNVDTGFISHAAFLFFLVNEFNRYQKDPQPLSVVRFDLAVKPANAESTIAPLPQKAIQEAGKRIFSVMRSLDWVAHYEHEYAILMPFTSRTEAGQLTQAIARAIGSSPLVPGLDNKMLGISFGVASMPDDCTHPGVLLAAAQDAKNRARKAGVPVMLFSDGI